MVRWLGARRVIEFVEYLIEMARQIDPAAALFLRELSAHGVSASLERRFLLVQRLPGAAGRFRALPGAAAKPGGGQAVDHGRIRPGYDPEGGGRCRRTVLSWHLDCVVRGGAAGTIFFSWTDEWFTGGFEVTDWAFGLVTRERTPKLVCHVLQQKAARRGRITQRVGLKSYPRVSIIVCSYNGGKTLKDCLESLDELNYPDFEVILVDDGSKDETPEVVRRFKAQRAGGLRLADAGCRISCRSCRRTWG